MHQFQLFLRQIVDKFFGIKCLPKFFIAYLYRVKKSHVLVVQHSVKQFKKFVECMLSFLQRPSFRFYFTLIS